jgi:hypothetical protein
MQLLVKRGQRAGGLMGGKVVFQLDLRAEYAPEEKAAINKYNLGGEAIYNSGAAKRHLDAAGDHLAAGTGTGLLKGLGAIALAGMKLNITIASLAKGHHIECKDLAELVEAEATIADACKNVKTYLDVAATFDGREVLIDIEQH